MVTRYTRRYCADAQALAAMKRDGMGWGHDVQCGCFHDVARSDKPGGFARIVNAFKRRT